MMMDGKSWSRIATIHDTEIEDYEDTDVANGEGYGIYYALICGWQPE